MVSRAATGCVTRVHLVLQSTGEQRQHRPAAMTSRIVHYSFTLILLGVIGSPIGATGWTRPFLSLASSRLPRSSSRATDATLLYFVRESSRENDSMCESFCQTVRRFHFLGNLRDRVLQRMTIFLPNLSFHFDGVSRVLTSCAGEFLSPKFGNISSVLSIFKCNPGKTNDQLRLNRFYPVISYRPAQKKEESVDFIVHGSVTRYGPRTSCQRKGLTNLSLFTLRWRACAPRSNIYIYIYIQGVS